MIVSPLRWQLGHRRKREGDPLPELPLYHSRRLEKVIDVPWLVAPLHALAEFARHNRIRGEYERLSNEPAHVLRDLYVLGIEQVVAARFQMERIGPGLRADLRARLAGGCSRKRWRRDPRPSRTNALRNCRSSTRCRSDPRS